MAPAQPSAQTGTRIKRLTGYRWSTFVGIALFATLLSGYACYSHERLVNVSYLQLLIKSSEYSTAQIFYDTGNGLSEGESQTQALQNANTFQSLRFPLPHRPIRLLRFDPLTKPGRVVLRRAELVNYDGSVEKALPLESLRAANDISSIQLTAEGLVIETIPTTNDPQTIFALQYPIIPPRPSYLWTVLIGFSWFIGSLLFSGALLFAVPRLPGWSLLGRKLAEIDQRFALVAQKMSNTDFIGLDRFAIWFYTICLILFLITCLAGLHGSSIDIFSTVYHRGAPGAKPLIGTPRGIRVDEWNFHTPIILNQYFRRDQFSPIDTLAGPGNAGLIANVPVRHFTTVLRPEFWSFFVLPFNYAYSVYWEAKWFILLTGLFTLLLLVTHSSLASAIGALWFLFSASTQWQLSWPSLLPDLIGLCCWSICLACYLLVSRNLLWACIAVVCLIGCTVDFAMCAYIPHQIPLVCVALCGIAFWIIAKAAVIWDCEYRWRRLAVILLALCIIALVLGFLYRDIAATIKAVASTSYPGHRSVGGGTYNLLGLGSHLLDLWKTEGRFPPPLVNICEGTGFLWLAPVTLFCFSRSQRLDREQKTAFVCFGLIFILIFSWEILPIPANIARVAFFDRVPPGRAVPALGLVNIVLVTMALAWRRKPGRYHLLGHLIDGAGIFSMAWIILALVDLGFANFFGLPAVTIAALLVAISVKCLLEGWMWGFSVIVIGPLVLAYSSVNPVDRGFDSIFRSELFQTIQSQPSLRKGKWLVFSKDYTVTGLFAASGVDVFNGLKYVPDVKDLELFDKTGSNRFKFNNSGYLLVDINPNGSSEDFDFLPTNGLLVWKVDPLDSRLRQIGIRYLAFESPPPPAILRSLKPAANNPVSTFWIYELP